MGSRWDALHTGLLEGWSPRLTDLVAAEIRTGGETLWLDPKVPVIKAGKELGTIIKQSAEASQHEPKDGVSGRREAATPQLALIFGVGGLEMHPVLGGASVPCGEDSSEVRVSVFNTVEHGKSQDILEGRLKVKGNEHPG